MDFIDIINIIYISLLVALVIYKVTTIINSKKTKNYGKR
jgi:hypothetical protein